MAHFRLHCRKVISLCLETPYTATTRGATTQISRKHRSGLAGLQCQRRFFQTCVVPWINSIDVFYYQFCWWFHSLGLVCITNCQQRHYTKNTQITLSQQLFGTVQNCNTQGEMKSGDGVVVVHPTCYDGAVELAGLQLGFAVAGSSSVEAHHKCAQDVVKTHLLKEWGILGSFELIDSTVHL